MKFTILSKKLSPHWLPITFSRPGTGYIYADLNGQSGTLGYQICDGGKTTGSTIVYCGDSDAEFAATCRRWYRAYVNNYTHYY